VYGIGIASALLSPRAQRLGDLAAGTVVVRESRMPVAGVATGLAPATGVRLGAARLSDDEIRVVETFLQRREGMDADVPARAAEAIAARVRHRLGLTADGDNEELLERILAERLQS